MTPCCVRLTISTSRTCGSISPGRKPRSMMPIPPSSAWTMAIGARVTVSMLADTIGRFSVMPAGEAAGQIDGRRIPARQNTALRCENVVIERAASHAVENGSPDGGIDDRKHGVIVALAIRRIGNHAVTTASSRALVARPPGRDASRRPGPAEVRAVAGQTRAGAPDTFRPIPAPPRRSCCIYPRAERRRHPAHHPGQRTRPARRPDQPARRRDRRRRDAERDGAARGGRGNRGRPRGRAGFSES